jgi:hypothetical protein
VRSFDVRPLNIDAFVKGRKCSFPVIPANPGSGSGTGAGIQCFQSVKSSWTPFFNGVTTFSETVNIQSLNPSILQFLNP